MTKEKQDLLDKTFQTFVEVCFSSRNMGLLRDIVIEDVVGIGSAIDEKIFGLDELIILLNRQKDQSTGLEIRWELNTLNTHYSDDENTAIYTCEAKLFVTVDDAPLVIDLRLSTVLEYRENKWQVVHWHGSKPEAVESEKDTWGIQNWKEKAAELEKQVAERTADLLVKNHELAIEAALERVRAVAMGMKKPEDLLDVCRIIAAQLQRFGVEHIRNVQLAIINESIGQYICYQYFPNYDETIIEDTQYNKSPVEAEMVRQMLACCDGHFIGCLAGEELETFRLHRKREKQFPDSLMDEASEISYAFLSIGEGGLGLSLYGSMEDGVLNLFKRFHQVFNLTYQRFRDLQKAEAQAKEAQVEAALERVRSHSMAMQHSDELNDLIGILYRELTQLEVSLDRCFIMTFDASVGDSTWWMASGDEIPYKTGLKVPYKNHAPHKAYLAGWSEQKEKWQYVLEGKEKKDWDDFLFGSTELEKLPDTVKEGMKGLGRAFLSASFRSFGCLTTGSFTPLHNEAFDLLVRFTHVFDQSYTRFLDLKKAEAQAREAMIEAALEKVRSRSMAMHKSEELKEVIQVVYEQFVQLDIPAEHTGFIMDYETRDDFRSWIADKFGTPSQVTIPYFDCIYYNRFNEAKEKGINSFSVILTREEKNKFYQDLFKHVPGFPEESKGIIFSHPGFTISTVLLENVALYIENFTGIPFTDEEDAILRRFGRVFQQTYTRFLDLQKAEAQAREAQIETAMERIRARAMAMHSSAELVEVAQVLREQMGWLNQPDLETSAILIYHDDLTSWDSWYAFRPTQDINGVIRNGIATFNKDDCGFTRKIARRFQSQEKDYTLALSGAEREEWIVVLMKAAPEIAENAIANETVNFDTTYFHFSDFSGGSLLTVTYHPPSEEIKSLQRRAASVFDLAYRRFLDLKKAEAQAREAEIQLALERVRARAMAMQKSDELAEAATILFQQVKGLGIETYTSGFTIWENDDKDLVSWMCNAAGSVNPPFRMPAREYEWHRQQYDAWKRGDEFIIHDFVGQAMQEHYAYLRSFPLLDEAFKISEAAGVPTPGRQVHNAFNFAHGNLLFITQQPVPEAYPIFKRFASTFEQTYTRFLDLQKAEAQAREAQVEAALERIRGKVTAMQESPELLEIVVSMRSEFVALGHEADYFWYMRWLPEKYEKAMTSGDGSRIGMVMTLPRHIHGDIQLVADWERSNEPALVFPMDVDTAVAYVEKMITLGDFQQVDPQAPTLDDIRHIGGLTFVMARTSEGEIGYSLAGVVPNPPAADVATLVRFAGVFDLAYRRFEDLKLAEQRNRQTQIDLALERTRTQSMLMQHSDELLEISKVFHEQLLFLHMDAEFSFVWLPNEDKGDHLFWATWMEEKEGEKQFHTKAITYPLDMEEPYTAACFRDWRSGVAVHEHFIKPEEVTTFFASWEELLAGADKLKPAFFADGIYYTEAYMRYGCFGINIRRALLQEEKEILLRFAIEFERAYTRFLDLQKAEAQAREAQIEAALERVRSRSMAMHDSNELGEVAKVMFNQMKLLGGDLFAFGIVLCHRHKNIVEQWHGLGAGDMMTPFQVPVDLDYIHRYRYDQWKAGVELFSIEIPSDYIDRHFELMFELPSVRVLLNDLQSKGIELAHPSWEIDYGASFGHGYLLVSSLQPYKEAKIFPRFAKVFEQAYTRFLDLQKAEAQAREAQIEAALERVRSRSMAMHKSEELSDLSLELVKQVQALGVATWFCAFNIYDEQSNDSIEWGSNGEGVFSKYRTPREGVFLRYYEAGQRGETLHIHEITEDKCPAHYEYLCSLPGVGDQLLQMKEAGILFPRYQIDHVAFFKQGYLLFITYEPVPETHDIFKRFAKVFEQSYTRFLDLKNAEAQAREAKIEAALEKVRSRTLAMQRSDELAETAAVLFRQLISMGIEPNRLYIILMKEDSPDMEAWVTDEDGSRVSMGFKGNYTQNVSLAKMYAGWKEKGTSLVIDMQGDELQQYFQYLHNQLKVPFKGGLEQKRRVQHIAYFSHGLIGMASPDPQPAETLQLLERFAAVFNLTYTRFSDLKIAEAHALQAEQDLMEIKAAKQKAEEALTELQATQKQLIQAEKMASLGELTAGIAHEIQNPLNFVNNFSEVSRELIEELMDEVEKGNMDEVKLLAGDVVQNLEKIHHHGKRADGIVKGMLQHSRSGTGQKELTDINALCDEYLRLAYHGLKARDKGFNAKFEMIADPNLPLVNVMQQEMGRVILNLINNAFYAVAEKKRTADPDYIPEVKVSTKLVFPPAGGLRGAEISVEDNGNGIPDSIREKIFQPFFTTKPTGQGTGLGLSLSYDIVKAHGGTITLESEPLKFTRFIISLNIND